MQQIYVEAGRLIHDFIRRESIAQGHHLTGNMEDSLQGRISKVGRLNTLSGYAAAYTIQVNEGIDPEHIKDSMFPGLVKYFLLRGVANAEQAAAATLKKWKQEGMSTVASSRFSQTGGRHRFIEIAFGKSHIDDFMLSSIDHDVDAKYHECKSETV